MKTKYLLAEKFCKKLGLGTKYLLDDILITPTFPALRQSAK